MNNDHRVRRPKAKIPKRLLHISSHMLSCMCTENSHSTLLSIARNQPAAMSAVVSRVVPAVAVDALKEMASLLRLSGVMPNSCSGDADDRRVLAFHKMLFVGRESLQRFARRAGDADCLVSSAMV